MKQLIHTILIWSLTLSLTGWPVISQSQDIYDLKQTENNMSMPASDTQTSEVKVIDVHCHTITVQAGKNILLPNQKAVLEEEITTPSAAHDCCCGSDCQCQHDMTCQSAHHFSALAILLSELFISSPSDSQLVTDYSVLYHNYDSGVEISPPII